MKICMITSGHSPYDDRIYYKEILSLKKKNFDIYIIAPYNKDCITSDKVKIKSFKRQSGIIGRIKNLYYMYKIGVKLNCDVYHAHEPDSLLIAFLLKRKLGVKIIYDSHEYHPEAFAEHFKFGKKTVRTIIYLYEKFLGKKVDYIITVNNLLVNKFNRYNKHVLLLPNYPVINDDFKDLKKDFNSLSHFIYIGGLREDRGILKILESIKYLKDKKCKITFIGPFENIYFEDTVKRFVENNLNNIDINFTGKIPHIEVFEYLKSASAGFVLLQPENWRYVNSEPIKIFEYMMTKTPVIASDFPMFKNIVEKSECGVTVDPKNPKEIAKIMENFINNKNNLEQMSTNGYQKIVSECNWGILEKKLLELYSCLDI